MCLILLLDLQRMFVLKIQALLGDDSKEAHQKGLDTTYFAGLL